MAIARPFSTLCFLISANFSLAAQDIQPNSNPPLFTDYIDRYLASLNDLENTGPPVTIWQRTSEKLINTRNIWSQIVGSTGQRLDGFFAGRDAELKTNASFVRAGFEYTFAHEGNLDLSPFIKFKLDLPTLQENLRVVIENNPDEEKSLSDAKLENSNPENDNTTSFGLQQVAEDKEKKWRVSSTFGLRIDSSPEPFWRGKYDTEFMLEAHWSGSFQDSLYYYHQEGWLHLSQIEFNYPLENRYLFRVNTEAQWLHNERIMEYAHSFSWLKELSRIRAIKYEVGLLAHNQPNVKVTDYYSKIVYRRKLYKSWLFYEMIPAVLFPATESFEAQPEFTIRLEVVFSAIN